MTKEEAKKVIEMLVGDCFNKEAVIKVVDMINDNNGLVYVHENVDNDIDNNIAVTPVISPMKINGVPITPLC